MSLPTQGGTPQGYESALARTFERFVPYMNSRKAGRLFDAITMALVQNLLSPGDSAIDIGASFGTFTIPLAEAVGRSGRVYAFEPIPGVFKVLERTVQSRGLDQVELIRAALSNHPGTAPFLIIENDTGHSGLKKKYYPFEPQTKEITVEVTTLDEALQDADRIRFIKADIEGGEFHAFQGGREILRKHRPVIVFECAKYNAAKFYEYTKEEFFAFFEEVEYELKDLLGCRCLPEHWDTFSPWMLVAFPSEDAAFMTDMLSVSIAENIIGYPW